MHKNIFRQGSEKKYFSRTLREFKDFSRQELKFQDLFKTVRTMRAGVEIRPAQLHNLLYFSPPSGTAEIRFVTSQHLVSGI